MSEQGEAKVYSVIELDNAVAAGSITQQQRDQIFAKQVNDEAVRNATNAAFDVVESKTRENDLDGELKQYAALVPDIMNDSGLRRRVQQEFEALGDRGLPTNKEDPRSLATELAAVRAVLGPLERVRAHKEGRRVAPTPFGDTTGARVSPQQRREDDKWNTLDKRQRDHYEDLIRKNIYPNRQAALAELGRSQARREGRPIRERRSA